ncbi:MAG: hypothetical protein FD167_5418, partial [bacterium]
MYKLFRYRFIVLLLITLFLCLSSCYIKSLNPIFTEKDLIFEPELIGEWIGEDEESEAPWLFQKASNKGYDLILPVSQKSNTEFEANLVKIGDFTFLDLYPKEPKKADFRNDFYKEHFIAVHSFCLVSLTSNELELAFLDISWFKEKFGEEKINISHIVVKNNLILTTSTEDLQKLLLEYAAIKEAFSFSIKLKRKVKDIENIDKSKAPGIFVKEKDPQLNLTKDSLFNLQSSFWINLHHFLYQQALLKTSTNGKPALITPPDPILSRLTPTQKRLWDKAINFYQNNYIKKDLLFSDEMTDIKQRLVKVNSENDLKKAGLPNPLVDILVTVAPIYQNTWWIIHDRTNQAFISNINIMLSFFEPALVQQFKQ